MALKSQIFAGDAKLEAAAVSDPAHILPGAAGAHVAKIQTALIELDDANITVDSSYGPKTAAAVLAFKQARNIINRTRQTTVDNIVGTMTMAALDREMLAREGLPPPISRARFVRANPANRADGFSDGRRGAPGTVTAQQSQTLGLVGAPQQAPRFFEPLQFIVAGDANVVALIGGKGATITSEPENVVAVVSPGRTEVMPVDRGFIRLRGGRPGNGVVIASDAAGREIARMRVITAAKIEREISFTYLTDAKGGTSGVATTRTPGDEVAMLQIVNGIYNPQAGIFFTSKNRKLNVPQLDANSRAIDVDTTAPRARDWTKIFPTHRDHAAPFNIFYCKLLNDFAGTFKLTGGITEIVGADTEFRDSIIDNRNLNKLLQSDAMNLVHELGHACGQIHRIGDAASIMSDNFAVGTVIDLKMAQEMRRNLLRFKQQ